MYESVYIECGRCDYKGEAEYSPIWCGIICPQCINDGRRPLVYPDFIGACGK